MAYRYLADGIYIGPTGYFRLDRDGTKIQCDPKAGTVPCGDTCRLPANCKETKGFGQGADRAKIQQAEDQQLSDAENSEGARVQS